MITTLLLSCAMALPPATIPDRQREYNVSIFKFLALQYHAYHEGPPNQKYRAYIFGGDTDLAMALRSRNLESWRMTIRPEAFYDFVGLPTEVPLERESAVVLLYLLGTSPTKHIAKRLFIEAVRPIMVDGYLVFYEEMALHFEKFAHESKYERLPFDWYGMQIWQKKRGGSVKQNVFFINA